MLWWEKEAQEPNQVGFEWEGDSRERVSWELSLWAWGRVYQERNGFQAEGRVYAKIWRLEREVQFVQWGVKGEARRARSWPWKGSQEQEPQEP